MNVLRRSVRVRVAKRFRRSATHLLALVVGLVVALPVLATVTATPASAAPADDGILRVLLFYKPNFHASNVQARQAIRDLAAELGTQYAQPVEIQETDDPAVFTPANLATKDTLAFAQTGGVLFNEEQRTALEAYIRGGGGFMGMHYTGWSVGQSEHDVNPFYNRLVGAVSEGHPENPAVRPGRVFVKDTASPLTQGIPAEFTRSDEWYDWVVNPAPNVHTLLEADESSYVTDASGGRNGTSHPVTWCQTIDAGRSWYSGMGHEGTAFSEPNIRTQLRLGLAYSAGLLAADCSPPAKDVAGGWSGVTPWPLVAINASLTADGMVQTFGSTPTTCNDTTPYDWTGNGCVSQGGQFEFDVWDPATPRTLANVNQGRHPNNTYTDMFCSMQVQNPRRRTVMTVGGDDGLGENAPNDAAIGVTSYSKNKGLQNEAPMNFPRWYPTGTTMPNGDIVVQGGSSRGGPGGPGVLTPEIFTPDAGSGWRLLNGATSSAAYGDGGADHPGADENRWWYPRAFVTPGSGTLFNITGTQMYELDPAGNAGEGALTLRGTLPTNVSNQGALGNPVGATSTAAMYAPGKILQVGGGWWANGGGPAGAKAGFTVDITGGTANPVVTPIAPMKFARHWPTATVLPNGEVLVTGGSRDNNGNGGYVTTAEIWNPDSGQWRTVEAPYEHARLYHSTALLLPDGRVMVGGGGAPGPRNYTDVEYYSPSYLYDGNQAAARPEITSAPKKIGYNGTFGIQASGPVAKVTLVRNGSVTHGFNNDQNFQQLDFTQSGNNLTIKAPTDGTYAPPGAYMLFVWNADGTPSAAKILDIDPAVKTDDHAPKLVDQFEYPRIPADWRGGNPAALVDVAAGGGRMAPWTVKNPVQLVRSTGASQGGLGQVGYHLGLGASGSLERSITGLDPGRSYRISLKYARDSRSAGTVDGKAAVKVGSLDATLTATTANPSQNGNGRLTTFKTYVDTFTASARSETLTLSAPGGAPGVMIDDLVITAVDPGLSDVPIHYELDEGTGTTAANTGTDSSVGPAVLTGTTGWSDNGIFGTSVNLPGGSNASAVDLPDNLLQTATDFTTSFWVRPDTKGNWIGMFHLGDGLGDAGSFFQIQMQTQAAGATGVAATFKKKGSNVQERVFATPVKDVTANQWNHVVFTRSGATGTLYLDGVQIASRNNLTITMADLGPTANNWLGRNGYPDPAYDGLMDDVRLYTSSLTAADVAALYADGTAKRTTTTVTVSPASPSPFAEPLTVSGTVRDEAIQPATGTAELWVDAARVGEPVALVAGNVSFPALTLPPGPHQIEIRYLAAAGFRSSTATVTHTVSRPPPGSGVPIRYAFDEGTGTTAANTGSDTSVGAATLQGATTFTPTGKFGPGINLPGGASTTNNQVRLPDNIEAGMDEEFSVSVWARPDALPNWVPLLQIGSSTDTFFLLQSSTQAAGATGFAATFKAPGNAAQERLTLGAGNDLPLNEWTHVVFTMSGSTGRLYFDGELVGTRADFTLGIGDVGVGGNTTANFLGGTSWPDPRFDGMVDDFRMYGYELTGDQVDELYAGPPVTNAAPVGVADAYSTDQDEALTVVAPGVLTNDTDADADTLTATGLTQPAHGVVTLAPTGAFTYTPTAGYSGTDTFTYKANDGTVDSAATTVTITVAEVTGPTNATPVAVSDTFVTDEDVALTVAAPGVLTNDTDADGDDLTAAAVTQPAHGDVTLGADGAFTYTPDAGFVGVDSFTYAADDGTVDSAPATVSITVEEAGQPSPNQAPTAVADVFLTQQDVPLTVAAPGVLGNDADPDGDVLTAVAANQPAHGQVVLSGNGSFIYTPDRGFSGYDMFLYKVNDGTVDSGLTTVTIAVDAVPPAATAVAAAIAPFTYGQRGVLSTAMAPATATGEVTVLLGTRTIAGGTLTDGQSRIVLPVGSVPPGAQVLTLRYAGDDDHAASTTTVPVTVAKAAPTLKVTAPKQVRKGQRPTVRVQLTAPGGVPVTGRVSVKVGGVTLTGTVRNGAVALQLPRAAKVGSLKVTVTYLGSTLARTATKTVTVRVTR
ncbi:LamG-like jellyroll fold domain-containing protein [Nocardioides sp.]|uniref:LamG-like jellyroll fold domain-containing protein n=1 Tax=Nocardioides sp. TaxID=35761 RepID=UPI00271E5672|nr:LamG-like jellyroll fold domain-containing protein [Nocardioides sp.]MDO9456450.1 LamG-like jellyroll fold domain-containing protein [Nocardioides sp.]